MSEPISSLIQTANKGHICIFAYEAWGHARPMCTLSARIVKARPTWITFFASVSLAGRIETELARSLGSDGSHLRAFIRVVLWKNERRDLLDTSSLDAGYIHYYTRLVAGKSLTCVHTGIEFPPVPQPSTVILDFFAKDLHEHISKISGDIVVHKHIFWTASASLLFFLFGPEHMGGRGDIRPRVEAEINRSGRDFHEVSNEVALGVDGVVVRVPGMPPMYDHEYHPQELPMLLNIGNMWLNTFDMLRICDGLIMSTAEAYEAEAVSSVRKWFNENSRNAYTIGPLFPLEQLFAPTSHEGQLLSGKDSEILGFMNEIMKSHGPKSLVYISFGTAFWSREPDKIWAFLDVVMEMNIPFVMSHASPFAVVPASVSDKVKKFGKGLLSPWSPQQKILVHPVTAWFVTHGGHNSVLESVTEGVPMIIWPFHADQPLNAIHATHSLDIAYELFEVRNGHGLKPRYRDGRTPVATVEAVRKEVREILENAFGKEGAQKRLNVLKLKDKLDTAWSEGGSARAELATFLDSVAA